MIPAVAHFIWFGSSFPWIYGLALRSAALRGGLDRVVLHHADPVEETPGAVLAMDTPGVTLRPLSPEGMLEATGSRGGALVDLYRRLDKPAARANMVRAALLYARGGVYLDTDTVTVASLAPLLSDGAFCGEEHLVLPPSVVLSRRPGVWLRAGALLALRDLARRKVGGERWFARMARLYPTSPNNAVLGAVPRHPLLESILEGMLDLGPARQTRRYALGTHLLAQMVQAYRGSDLRVHPPPVFFPLGPEISEQWFRPRADPDPARLLSPETRVVHWYASVRTRKIVPLVDPEYVRANSARQPFSRLAAALLG